MSEYVNTMANDEKLRRLCAEFGVEKLELFGSAVSDRFDPLRSDFDFLVTFKKSSIRSFSAYFDFLTALEEHFGRKIDLIEDSTVRNPYLRRSIDRSRQPVFVES